MLFTVRGSFDIGYYLAAHYILIYIFQIMDVIMMTIAERGFLIFYSSVQ